MLTKYVRTPSWLTIVSMCWSPFISIPVYSTVVPIGVLGMILNNKSYTSFQVAVTWPISFSFGIKDIIDPCLPSPSISISPLFHKWPSMNSACLPLPTTNESTVNLEDNALVTDAPHPFLPAEYSYSSLW